MTSANVHTPTMTLKNAALMALIGTVLMTALLLRTFIFNVLNSAGLGSCCDAVLVVRLCVRLFQRGRLLLRIP